MDLVTQGWRVFERSEEEKKGQHQVNGLLKGVHLVLTKWTAWRL